MTDDTELDPRPQELSRVKTFDECQYRVSVPLTQNNAQDVAATMTTGTAQTSHLAPRRETAARTGHYCA